MLRPLPAMRGFAVPDHAGVRLRTLADAFAYAETAGIRLRIDGAETPVRCPKAGRRIRVEHANAELRQWRPLQRYTGPREDYAATHQAIASLVSDRSARRPTRRKPSTELMLARQVTC